MRNSKTMASVALLALAIAGCGGDDEDGDTTEAETAPPATAPERPERDRGGRGKDGGKDGSKRPNNDPVVEEDLGTKPIGKLRVTEKDFALRLSEQALMTEGVWTIEVTNRGKQAHALDVEGPNGESRTGRIAPGATKVVRAYLVSGDYELYCPIGNHAGRGMRTKLPVGRDQPE